MGASSASRIVKVAAQFIDNIAQFCRDFPQQSKAILAVMVGEMIFLSTYDRVRIPSQLVFPVVVGSLIGVAFAFDRIWR
jgi:hypothetical protein